MVVKIKKADALRAISEAWLGGCEPHSNSTARCGTQNMVSPLGAVLQAAKWNFHLADAYAAVQVHPELASMELDWISATSKTEDQDLLRMYAILLGEVYLPKIVNASLRA